jgi:hypothetical protein
MCPEDQLKAKEEEYWKLWAALDQAAFLNLFSDRVLAWPSGLPYPMGKDWFKLWTKTTFENIEPGTFNFKLGQMYVQMIDDRSGIIYYAWSYDATLKVPPGPRHASGQLSHTWVLENDWAIIGGTSQANATVTSAL